ncbi:hypothetical protein V8F20_007729, partial [Naviculisporaceae sp. PSN 640]
MTRPEIIRADSIDLQHHKAPSAQEHHRPAADGSFAPHQAETLREAVAGTAEERLRSPRILWNNGDVGDIQQTQQLTEGRPSGVAEFTTSQQRGPQDHESAHKANSTAMPAGPQQDAPAIAQNGGVSTHDGDDGDLDDTEVDMDDDMMDKISSSPSIEDGGSTFIISLPQNPQRHDTRSRAPPSPVVSDEARSSSPYLDHPDYLPLSRQAQQQHSPRPTLPVTRHHHLSGKY